MLVSKPPISFNFLGLLKEGGYVVNVTRGKDGQNEACFNVCRSAFATP
jgi:hypothetical protein